MQNKKKPFTQLEIIHSGDNQESINENAADTAQSSITYNQIDRNEVHTNSVHSDIPQNAFITEAISIVKELINLNEIKINPQRTKKSNISAEKNINAKPHDDNTQKKLHENHPAPHQIISSEKVNIQNKSKKRKTEQPPKKDYESTFPGDVIERSLKNSNFYSSAFSRLSKSSDKTSK